MSILEHAFNWCWIYYVGVLIVFIGDSAAGVCIKSPSNWGFIWGIFVFTIIIVSLYLSGEINRSYFVLCWYRPDWLSKEIIFSNGISKKKNCQSKLS